MEQPFDSYPSGGGSDGDTVALAALNTHKTSGDHDARYRKLADAITEADLDAGAQAKLDALPTPGAGDAAKVVTVKATEDGYELDVAAAGGTTPAPYEPVWAASDSNVDVASPGAAIGGYGGLADGNRVLLTSQTNGAENGLWVWHGAASPMTRPSDFADGSTQLMGGTVFVISGARSGTLLVLNGPSDPVIGTDTSYWTSVGPPPNSIVPGQVYPAYVLVPKPNADGVTLQGHADGTVSWA